MWLLFHPPFDHELWTKMIAQFYQSEISIPVANVSGKWLPLPVQGVVSYVACWSVCNRDQDFWSAKSVLDHLIIPSKTPDRLIFHGSKVRLQLHILDPLIFAVQRLPWSLGRFLKGFDRLIHFDPGHKCFYTGHISDYPLLYPNQIMGVGVHHQQPFHFHLLEQNLHRLCPASIVCSCMSWRE